MRAVVSLEDVRKSFGATRALDGVSFDLAEGEVHALVGENGAGKSTLINVLAGVVRPDSGRLVVDGVRRDFQTTHDAKSAGIATVFQELSLVDGLSIAENICAGRPPSRFGLIDRRSQWARSVEALRMLGVQLQPEMTVGRLLASQRQLVEVAKALDQISATAGTEGRARVLILDEPTSALNPDEKSALFRAVRALRSQGVAIIYISHHLDEVLALADRITVLRDGATVWTRPAAGMDSDTMVRAMVGRDVQRAVRSRVSAGDEIARFEDVGARGRIEGVSFSLRRGEILGVAGLDGSGRESVARLLAGIERSTSGRIVLAGRDHPGSLRAAMALGLGYVPDDRKTLGLFLDMPIAENAVAAGLSSVSRLGLMNADAIRLAGAGVMKRHGVKADSPRRAVSALSGGNQQKVLFGKWLRRDPAILVVEEPTKGVDIGAKRDIHDQLVAHARAGAAVLVVSSDLPELLELSDRIAVLHRGRIAGIVDGPTATEEMVMTLAAGATPRAA
ncbi:sugar ABC transporter ATP-binding protein [Kaistia dalseonensis]|uniref:ABC-type sugar transport system ATPase subunit n=1 Tax=Kaistia dalseonensis TaxID=410840 RepID=A0ABU0H5K4_9HYPH|nr:sugar ABC transporter ATP-binding protein [Kaistia dalseonensis]MCX5494471.1 sugar ABC transporter ATP-binding protein [Kaistia dalseonensis]MDQ0437050.1 ABC-type sugar transport system ATPase subunit [Kaistia dalseonensis]